MRSRLVAAVRRFLDERGFLEVETPVLQPLYGGALARPFTTHHNALDRDLYLRIATELYLKRLIVGGLEKVYELGQGLPERGHLAQAQPGVHDARDLRGVRRLPATSPTMTEELVAHVAERDARAHDRRAWTGETIDLSPPWRRVTLRDAILEQHRRRHRREPPRPRRAAGARCEQAGIEFAAGARHGVGQARGRAALQARRAEADRSRRSCSTTRSSSRRSRGRTAPSRGWSSASRDSSAGIEIANAFTELNDPDEQRRAVRAAAAAGCRRRRGGAAVRRGLRARARARACRRPAGSGWASTGC